MTALSVADALIDLIDDGAGGRIVVRRDPRGTDYERYDHRGTMIRSVRVKGFDDTGTVLSGDLWDALRTWAPMEAPECTFEFHADGAVFTSAIVAVTSRIQRLRRGRPTPEDLAVMRAAGVAVEHLGQVRIQVRRGLGRVVLHELRRRTARLTANSAANKRGDADELLVELARTSAGRHGDIRVVTADEAAAVAGVDRRQLATTDIELAALTNRFRASLARRLPPPTPCRRIPGFPLVAQADGVEPLNSVAEFLAGPDRVTIVGPAALAKSTLAAVAGGAAAAGTLPIVVAAGISLSSPLRRAIREQAELNARGYVAPSMVETILTMPDLVILVDGFDDSAHASLTDDVLAACAHNSTLKVVATSRTISDAEDLPFPVFRLSGPPEQTVQEPRIMSAGR